MIRCEHCGSTEYTCTVSGGWDYHYKDGKRISQIYMRGDAVYQCSNCGEYMDVPIKRRID